MDPRIGWHPNELISEAYSTWTNVWMIAQMNCTTSQSNSNSLLPTNATHSQTCNVNTKPDAAIKLINSNDNGAIKYKSVSDQDQTESNGDNSSPNQYKRFMSLLENANCTCNNNTSVNNLNHVEPANNYQHNNSQNMSVTSQTILNGLKSRKVNKASTFGFNFPINQHILGRFYSRN